MLNIINKKVRLSKTSIILQTYGGHKVKPLGIVKLKCSVNDLNYLIDFVIVDMDSTPLLGLSTCESLGLIKRSDSVKADIHTDAYSKEKFINDNSDIFAGLGKFSDKMNIKIKDNAKPFMTPPRRVPQTIKERLKVELDKMEALGIIKKADSPREWVSGLVIIEKKDKSLRLCMDPQELNKNIIREQFLIPTLEEISPKLKGKKYFTVLDFKEGFYQIPLTEEVSKLCAFSTPFGVYDFLRLPFGLISAPEYFQKVNQANFADIKNVTIYFDDVLIVSETLEEHIETLNKVIERARLLNIKFNKNKVQFMQTEVKYLGHIFNEEGIKPDTDRIRAVTNMPCPNNKKELQRFLGLVNYFRNFIPNLSQLTADLRKLLKKNSAFTWSDSYSQSIENIKNKITNSPVLSNFSEKEKITIQTDASKDGLGCCLLQCNKPICFASRSLTETEQHYAQIEKEFLAVIFACQKFHHFIYGRHVTIHTDHKPLVSIMKKDITKVGSVRLQRLKIKLLKYNITLEYVPVKFMYVADALARAYLNDSVDDDESLAEIVHSISQFFNILPKDGRKKYKRAH